MPKLPSPRSCPEGNRKANNLVLKITNLSMPSSSDTKGEGRVGFCSRCEYSFSLRLGQSGGVMGTTFQPIDELCINTIRTLSIDAVQKANSGHPGMPLGAAPMAYILWTRHLRHNPTNPKWPDRDRFVLSAGHASMLLYSLLFLTGYDLTMADIQQFRRWGSRTPGHPEYGVVPGAEVTTGPLGQGVGNAVGFAIAER